MPGGEQTTTSSHTRCSCGDHTHHGRARVGSAPPWDVYRCQAHRNFAQGHTLTLGQRHGRVFPHPGLGNFSHIGDCDLQPRDDVQRESSNGLVKLLLEHHQRPGLDTTGIEHAREPQHCLITVLEYVVDDLARTGYDGLGGSGTSRRSWLTTPSGPAAPCTSSKLRRSTRT